jgi:hypothetical protein
VVTTRLVFTFSFKKKIIFYFSHQALTCMDCSNSNFSMKLSHTEIMEWHSHQALTCLDCSNYKFSTKWLHTEKM